MRKILAALLLAAATVIAIPAVASSPSFQADSAPSAEGAALDTTPEPTPLDTHCCPACIRAGGICHPGIGTTCLCE